MTYLIHRARGNRYWFYCPDTYGMETWGMNSQEEIIFKRKHWYVHTWRAAPFFDCEDYTEDVKLNIVFVSSSEKEVFEWLEEHKARQEDIETIRKDIAEAKKDLEEFTSWIESQS